jgi:4-hydroxy-tetrahydrodipicolinate reductase
MQIISIGILGIMGRMGQAISTLTQKDSQFQLIGGTLNPESNHLIQETNLCLSTNPDLIFEKSDILIDFTNPEILIKHLNLSKTYNKPIVIGTTGLTKTHHDIIDEVAQTTPVLYASNMSLGINVLQALVEKAASILGSQFDIEILEKHHNQKIDAPSGTALSLGQAAAKGRKINFEKQSVLSWVDHPKRKKNEIGFAVQRGGDMAGEHVVSFFGPQERIELSHSANSRQVLAYGALKAASWIYQKKPGRYSMMDVLELQ